MASHSENDIIEAARALVRGGRPEGGETNQSVPWWCYEWDGSVNCVGCSAGYHPGVFLDSPADYVHKPDCRAMALERAVLADDASR